MGLHVTLRGCILYHNPLGIRLEDATDLGSQLLAFATNPNAAPVDTPVRRVVMVQDKLAAKQFEAEVLNEDRVEIDGDLRWVIDKLKALLKDAEGDEDRILQLGSLREIRQSLLALAELQGKLNKELTVHLNLNESPQFLTLREIILRVLDRHPDAKADFLDEMRVLKVLP